MRLPLHLALVSPLCLTWACAGVEEDPAPAAEISVQMLGALDADSCKALALPELNYAAQIAIEYALGAGEEHEVCALFDSGPRAIALNSSEVKVSLGSHHGVLWQTNYTSLPALDLRGEPIELGQVVPCEGSATSRFDVSGIVAGSQGKGNLTAPGALPPNAALTLPPHTYLVMNFHVLNSHSEAIDTCMKVGLVEVPPGQIEHEAGVLFLYDPFIAIAPASTSSARMACPFRQTTYLKSAASHMHKHGVNYVARLLDGDPLDPGSELIQTLYQTDQWDAPLDQIWDKALEIEAGHWIDYQCDYQNAGLDRVAQGLDTSDEMCVFSGMYWPKDSITSFCLNPEKPSQGPGSGGYQIGQGTLDGLSFMYCVLLADFDHGAAARCGRQECENYDAMYTFQRCFIDACPAIGKYTRSYVQCIKSNGGPCSKQCEGEGQNCILECLNADKCHTQADALTGTHCD